MRVKYELNNETVTGELIKIDQGMVAVRVDNVTTRTMKIADIKPVKPIKL